jgi:hypothetical protein
VRAGVGGTSAALLFAAFAIVLFVLDPATAGFYPPCLFRTVLGMRCPGCGSLRAVHQLLHGDLAAAWALNGPVVVALPLSALADVIGVIARRTKSSNG